MPEDTGDADEANSLSPAQLAAFLTAMRTRYPQHYALVVLLAYTGLRFCHASALHWNAIHGLRYTFTDLVRRANVDAVVRRALTGHVTEEMQRHYSTVGLDEKRAAIAGVLRLVPPDPRREARSGGSAGGTTFAPTSEVS